MANPQDSLSEELSQFIGKQPLFFVATAPLSPKGHVNLSPKGLDSFRVLTPIRVAYADLTGSGNETSAHLLENGRITFMFCAFEGKPRILRIYGKGTTVLPDSPLWDELSHHFPSYPGLRQIILADITRIQTSCGFAVPIMQYVSDRDLLSDWAKCKGADKLVEYRQQKNIKSLDGLPTPLASR
jgi:hypothetical protein